MNDYNTKVPHLTMYHHTEESSAGSGIRVQMCIVADHFQHDRLMSLISRCCSFVHTDEACACVCHLYHYSALSGCHTIPMPVIRRISERTMPYIRGERVTVASFVRDGLRIASVDLKSSGKSDSDTACNSYCSVRFLQKSLTKGKVSRTPIQLVVIICDPFPEVLGWTRIQTKNFRQSDDVWRCKLQRTFRLAIVPGMLPGQACTASHNLRNCEQKVT
ncbi:hypothetical protein TNCV_558711 [Trichonephila clavipes]|nr:hypothetical protein TNCV_558711 [Trichonephila clavipes]